MKYLKTEAGQLAFKQRSPLFNAKQRSAFIVIDGSKTLAQVAAVTGVTQADVDHLVALGFLLQVVAPANGVPASPAAPDWPADDPWGPGKRTAQERYVEAMHLATQLTANLGLRGFRLNLALEAANGIAELRSLLPKIKDAVGGKACRQLEHVLGD